MFVDASEDIGGVGKSIEIIGSEGHQLVSGLHTIAVRFNKAVLADGFKAYLQFCPRFRDHLRRLAAGTKVYATNRVHIATAELRVPSLPEQRAIAAVLMDVDVLIGSLEALIAKKRAIKRAAMQQLLTGRTRLPGFDGEWGTMRLGECVQIRGDRVSSSKASGDTLCVELEDIEQATGRLIRRGLASSVSAKYSFETGDVLFGRLRPYLRKWWHADRPGVCSTEIWPLTSDPLKADSRFIYWLIRADTLYEAAQVSYGTHMPRADWKVVSEVPVPRPPIPEQRAIAAVLTDMDAEVEKLERRLAKTRAVKQGMMQQLLTGSIRLPIPDAIAESGPVQ
ncbi:MAG: restriction endonuclease subunit S [Gemmatimonadota bacterium]|nr:restriction endonuclease subunit S [Gemmatimonadota bacterium]